MNTSDYTYDLPPEKIANYPLAERDLSKLLVYQAGAISHSNFRSLADYLPASSFLFFNNTKVIPARLHFRKDTGAVIEIFLLNPISPSPLLAETMAATQHCAWHCAIGNLKKWNDRLILQKEVNGHLLSAILSDREKNSVEFRWNGGASFAEIIRVAGETPLPPYIKREAESADAVRYQTIYSHHDGAVAAPTAGLHFSDKVFKSLHEKGILHDFVTLHVSAGTFQPIKTSNPADHRMHEEQIIINRKNVENLLRKETFVVAVGTTSMRTLESLYWFGVKLLHDRSAEFFITQNDPYSKLTTPSAFEALSAVLDHMRLNNLQQLVGETSIFIRPGYSFRICNGLITNFHQPASTLILLVAAFVGDDWKRIYNEALTNNYRFLSYGDSSLLIPAYR